MCKVRTPRPGQKCSPAAKLLSSAVASCSFRSGLSCNAMQCNTLCLCTSVSRKETRITCPNLMIYSQAITGVNSVFFYSTTIFGLAGFSQNIIGYHHIHTYIIHTYIQYIHIYNTSIILCIHTHATLNTYTYML